MERGQAQEISGERRKGGKEEKKTKDVGSSSKEEI